jgi:hypothetical protein
MTDGNHITLAAETARALAAAAGSARLYPAGSPMTVVAIDRFVDAAARATAVMGTMRFVVDPRGLILGDKPLAETHAGVATLAESLYAHQAGQLIIGEGTETSEAAAFVGVLGRDPVAIRAVGGIRSALLAQRVTHLGVVELTLRTSEEQGLLGLDLTLAPGDQVAAAVSDAALTWAASASEGEGSSTRRGRWRRTGWRGPS